MANQLANYRSKEVATRHIYVSSCELEKYRALFAIMPPELHKDELMIPNCELKDADDANKLNHDDADADDLQR